MSAIEVLKASEKLALNKNQIFSHVTGKTLGRKKKHHFGATGFITGALGVALLIFSSGNLVPSALSERLIEETDVQYADAVASKILVFEQALIDGDVPSDTADSLKSDGFIVGYLDNETFVEGNRAAGSLVIKSGDKIITAQDFAKEINNNPSLYQAFNNATYSRAAYYYDESAKNVFKRIGTSRNNYTAESDFETVMGKLTGEGSNISTGGVALVEKQYEKDGEIITYYDYESTGSTSSRDGATSFIETARQTNAGDSVETAIVNTADTLNAADTISKEQKSEIFFLAFMENISKMKAGEGNESKINEAMNYLYRETETVVVDTETGEEVVVKGSMMDSPSLTAVLSGKPLDISTVKDYSSDRILNTVRTSSGVQEGANGTVVSTSSRMSGTVGRFVNGGTVADENSFGAATKIIDQSLIHNSFSDISGVRGGEMLVEGAVNVGKELAKASGATVGDGEAVKNYARLTSDVLAMEAKVDRMNRSPFDITSKNTFLGAIVYNFATSINTHSLFSQLNTVSRATWSAVASLMPHSIADDESSRYLANFGECETLSRIGAVGSATCAGIATFDTSTLNNTFNDTDFINFINNNTTIDGSGVRRIIPGSDLARFIIYNDERITPAGIMDGGIITSILNGTSSIPFTSNLVSLVKNFLGASEDDKRIATGAAFVNSTSNNDWQTYKYAQRYVSLARATEALRSYSDDETAYVSLKYFEGKENPVVAFINEYNSTILAVQR